jgi:hypothetical protein
MPEPEALTGCGQHAHGTRLVHRRDQVGHAPAQDGGQIGNREVDAEQGRGPQYLAHGAGGEAKAVSDGRRQRGRHDSARELGGPGRGDRQA